MATKAQIIDKYARSKDYYPWIAYEPIGELIVEEVERQGKNGLYLSTACALIQKESGFKLLFGCDHGKGRGFAQAPYCQVRVTRNRVKTLIGPKRNFPHGQNGIGLTQLTSAEFVLRAEKMGGAHLPRYQMRVGFDLLLELILDLGFQPGASAYNAGRGGWRNVYDTYGASVVRLQKEWANRLD